MNFLNRCAVRANAGGLGDFVLGSAIPGFYTPAQCQNPSVVDGGDYHLFAVSDDGTQHEESDGVWDAGTNTLTRATIRNSSNGGAKVNFSAAPIVYMGGPVAADIVQHIVLEITTGATPVDIVLADYSSWVTMAVRITSGGTAGTEIVNFVGPEDGLHTDTMPGRTINLVFTAQTDPEDIINITHNSGEAFSCIDPLGNSIGSFTHGIFDEVGNNITFGFNGDIIRQWQWTCLYGAWDSPTVIADQRNLLPNGGSYGTPLYAGGNGDGFWSINPPIPARPHVGFSTSFLTTNYSAITNPLGMSVVYDALSPVVGSQLVGGGTRKVMVIADIDINEYIVMFIFP